MSAPTSVPTSAPTSAPTPTPVLSPLPEVVNPRTTPWQHISFVFNNYLRYILSKTLMILLTTFSFYATWEVVLFVTVEYPEIQTRFADQQVSQAELDHVIATAVITVFATIVSAIFAIRLNTVQEKISHTIDICIAASILLFQSHFREYILSLEVIKNWSQYLTF